MQASRRRFLKTSAAATAASFAATPLLAAPGKKYRTAIIGAGWWGMNILRDAMAHGDACGERARWLDDTRRRADVIVRCRGLTTGRAADVHGVVSVEHRTGVLARLTSDVQSTTRRIDARFQLTELGPRVTRVHTA